MAESRLSIVIDSRTAEQKAKDVHRALQALEDAGVRVTATTESVSSAMAGQAQQSQRLVTNLNSARGAMGRMQQAQASIKAGQKGLFQPVQAQQYAQSVNRAAQATDGAAKSYQRAGLSAKQLQQAQRQLPMQFSDIWVSLASGQAPLQVAIQQGSQLKDSFGGIGPAARAMTGYIAGLINPVTLLAGTAAGLVIAFESGRDEAQQFNKTLTMTGNQAGVTTDRLMQMAAGMDGLADTTQNRAAAALNEVVKSGEFTADQFRTVTETALLMENATGQAIDKTVEQFAKIADDPVSAVVELNKEYGFLTEEVYNNIRALSENGDTVSAQRAAMEAYADTMRERASDIAGNLGWIEQAWMGIKVAAKDGWDAMLAVGREDTMSERIASLQDAIKVYEQAYGDASPGGVFGDGPSQEEYRRNQLNKANLGILEATRLSNELIGEEEADQNRELQSRIAYMEEVRRQNELNMTAEQELADIAEKRAEAQAKLSAEESPGNRRDLENYIAGLDRQAQSITESTDAYRDQQRAQKESEREAERLMKAYDRQANSLSQQIALYGETGEAAQVRYEIEHGALQDVSEARKQALIQQAEEVDRLEAQNKAQEEYEKRVESIIDTYDSQARKTHELRQAVETLNRAYKDPDVEMSLEEYRRAMAGIQEEMRKVALESDPLAKDMARAWTEAADRIDETFADAFTGAFDSFDDFADQLLDGFKRLLGELAYQATLRPIVVGFTADMQGMLGIGGAQSQGFAGTSAGIGDLFSTGQRAWDLGSSLFGGGASTAAGYGAGTFAGSATGAYGGWAGSATAGAAQASGGFMSAASSAMPWIGAGLLADNVFDLVIMDGITSAIGGLFGSSRKSYGQIGSELNPEVDANGVYRYERLDKYSGYAQQSALGTIGITKKQKTDDDALKRMVSYLVDVDNQLASVVKAAQLEDLKQELDGWKSSKTEDIGSIVGQRLSALIDATDTAFSDSLSELSGDEIVQGLVGGIQVENVGDEMAAAVAADMNTQFREALGNGDINAATQKILTAASAVTALGNSSDRLNLQFSDTVSGALSAAGELAQLFGGVQNITSQQQRYYDAFFSQEEKFDNLESDLSDRFDEIGETLPKTDAGVRKLVESLDLMTESGREQYAQILQLVPSLDRYIEGMKEQREAAREAAEEAREQAEAQRIANAEAAAQREALIGGSQFYMSGLVGNVNDALGSFNDTGATLDDIARTREAQLSDEYRAIESLSDLIDSLAVSDLATGSRLDAARQQYDELYQQAMGGDAEAAQELSGAAQTYLELARDNAGTAQEYARVYNQVTNGVSSLEAQFGESVDQLNDVERTADRQLREQEKINYTLLDSLQEMVDQTSSLDSIADLIDVLPKGLADQLSDLFPEYGRDVGQSAFNEAAYLANKTAQVNANNQGGRSDWTVGEVYDLIMQDFGSVYAHYQQYGRDEGVLPGFGSSTDAGSAGSAKKFNESKYLSNYLDYLNNRDSGERDWSRMDMLDAFSDANLTPYEHWMRYGRSEGVAAYATGAWQLPSDQLAMVHKDEMIVPSRNGIADEFRAYASGNGNAELLAEVKQLRRDMVDLNTRISNNTLRTKQILEEQQMQQEEFAE